MKKTKLNLDQKLLNYSISAGLVLAAQAEIQAYVVVHDVVPDTTLVRASPIFNIDFDQNGLEEFRVFFMVPPATTVLRLSNTALNAAARPVGFIGTDGLGGATWYAKGLQQGSSIPAGGAGQGWGVGGFNGGNNVTLAYGTHGLFPRNVDRYIAVKFQISGSGTHYGWVLVNINSAGTQLVIRSYAYELTAGMGISAPLPVELTSFSAIGLNNKIILNWVTATEKNNYGFDIERRITSSDTWEKIGFIQGSGNSNSDKQYSFVDNQPAKEILYYRLKQVDNDGSFAYSKELLVNLTSPIQFSLGQNYPNPFNPVTDIHYSIPESGNVKLKVYNALGEEVANLVNSFHEAGIYSVNFKGDNLPSGVYVYKLEIDDKFSAEKKMNLIK